MFSTSERCMIRIAQRQIREDKELLGLYHYYKAKEHCCIRDLGAGSPIYTLIINGIGPFDTDLRQPTHSIDPARFGSCNACGLTTIDTICLECCR